MRVLLDNCVVRRFGKLFIGHEVIHASAAGWSDLENGDLISHAEKSGFDVMITVDKNLQYQQNLSNRRISVIVLAPLFVYYDHLVPLVGPIQAALTNFSQAHLS